MPAPNFSPPADVSPTDETQPVSGIGGFVEIYKPAAPGEIGADQGKIHEGLRIKVKGWSLWHRFRTVEIPMSGGWGAVTRRLVATDFELIAALDFDRAQFGAGVVAPPSPFFDVSMTGYGDAHYMVAVLLQLGHPRFYPEPPAPPLPPALPAYPSIPPPPEIADPEAPNVWHGAYYYCPACLLQEIQVITSCSGEEVIGGTIKGRGSAPLRCYYHNLLASGSPFAFAETPPWTP